jgi:hypothetical protein
MVRLSIPLFFLANLAVGFASPFIRENDGAIPRDIECIRAQLMPFQNALDQFSPSSTADDVQVSLLHTTRPAYGVQNPFFHQCLHDLAAEIFAAFETAAFDAAVNFRLHDDVPE